VHQDPSHDVIYVDRDLERADEHFTTAGFDALP
jgi:hypothetical protein